MKSTNNNNPLNNNINNINNILQQYIDTIQQQQQQLNPNYFSCEDLHIDINRHQQHIKDIYQKMQDKQLWNKQKQYIHSHYLDVHEDRGKVQTVVKADIEEGYSGNSEGGNIHHQQQQQQQQQYAEQQQQQHFPQNKNKDRQTILKQYLQPNTQLEITIKLVDIYPMCKPYNRYSYTPTSAIPGKFNILVYHTDEKVGVYGLMINKNGRGQSNSNSNGNVNVNNNVIVSTVPSSSHSSSSSSFNTNITTNTNLCTKFNSTNPKKTIKIHHQLTKANYSSKITDMLSADGMIRMLCEGQDSRIIVAQGTIDLVQLLLQHHRQQCQQHKHKQSFQTNNNNNNNTIIKSLLLPFHKIGTITHHNPTTSPLFTLNIHLTIQQSPIAPDIRDLAIMLPPKRVLSVSPNKDNRSRSRSPQAHKNLAKIVTAPKQQYYEVYDDVQARVQLEYSKMGRFYYRGNIEDVRVVIDKKQNIGEAVDITLESQFKKKKRISNNTNANNKWHESNQIYGSDQQQQQQQQQKLDDFIHKQTNNNHNNKNKNKNIIYLKIHIKLINPYEPGHIWITTPLLTQSTTTTITTNLNQQNKQQSQKYYIKILPNTKRFTIYSSPQQAAKKLKDFQHYYNSIHSLIQLTQNCYIQPHPLARIHKYPVEITTSYNTLSSFFIKNQLNFQKQQHEKQQNEHQQQNNKIKITAHPIHQQNINIAQSQNGWMIHFIATEQDLQGITIDNNKASSSSSSKKQKQKSKASIKGMTKNQLGQDYRSSAHLVFSIIRHIGSKDYYQHHYVLCHFKEPKIQLTLSLQVSVTPGSYFLNMAGVLKRNGRYRLKSGDQNIVKVELEWFEEGSVKERVPVRVCCGVERECGVRMFLDDLERNATTVIWVKLVQIQMEFQYR